MRNTIVIKKGPRRGIAAAALVVLALGAAPAPAAADVTLSGDVTWGTFTAAYFKLEVDVDFTIYSVDTSPGGGATLLSGTSAHYSISLPDGTDFVAFITVSTCADGDPGCGLSTLGTSLTFFRGLSTDLGGGNFDIPIGDPDMGLGVFSVSGAVVVTPESNTLTGGSTQITSSAGELSPYNWNTRVPLELVGTDGTYSAEVLQGFADQDVLLNVEGCVEPIDSSEFFFPFAYAVDGPISGNDVEIPVSTAPSGSIEVFFDVPESLFPPAETSRFAAGSRDPSFVIDCEGGAQSGFASTDPFILADDMGDPDLTPGQYQLTASAAVSGPLTYEYFWNLLDLRFPVESNTTTQVTFSLESPVTWTGAADLSGWGAYDFVDVSGAVRSDLGDGMCRFSAGPSDDSAPVKLVGDAAATDWGIFGYTAGAGYSYADGSASVLEVRVERPVAPPDLPGDYPAPGLEDLGFTAAHWFVTGPLPTVPPDAFFGIAQWEGGIEPDFLIAAFAYPPLDAPESGFQATLAPGLHGGSYIMYWSDSEGGEHVIAIPLPVAMAAGDIEHRHISGPFISNIEPQPPTIQGQAQGSHVTIEVSATITDDDGVKKVKINGTSAQRGPGDTYHVTLKVKPGPNAITIVAEDRDRNETTHIRHVYVVTG